MPPGYPAWPIHVTAAGVLSIAGSLLWCGLIFVAIMGWGALLLRLCGRSRPGVVLSAASGFGMATLLGGLLDALRLITVPVLTGFVLVGAGLFILLLARDLRAGLTKDLSAADAPSEGKANRVAKGLLCVFWLVLCLRLVASVHTPYYQEQDDYGYHLGAPLKMLAEHRMPDDPFSERRIITSVGGYQFFNGLVLAVLPLEDLQMADRALGLLLTAMVALALARRFGLTPLQRAAFVLFVIATPQLQFNLTFVVLPSALFYALVYVAALEELRDREWLRAVLLGMLVAAVAGMKSPYIVHAVLFCTLFALYRSWYRRVGAGVQVLALAAVACFVVLLPWMLVNQAETGTMFFPVLGRGFHSSGYHQFLSSARIPLSQVAKKVLPFCAPMVVIATVELFWGERDEWTAGAVLLAAAAAIGSMVVGLATGGDSVRRYNYPCMLPAVLLAFPVFCRRWNLRRARGASGGVAKLLPQAFAFVSAALAIYVGTNSWTHEYGFIPVNIRAALQNDPIPTAPGSRQEYARIDAALPRDGGVLASVYYDFLIDYKGRQVLLADFPGAAGPRPGWPVNGSGEDLARYLEAHHIRYLVYSYAGKVGMPDAGIEQQLADPATTQVIRAEALAAQVAHRQFAQLAASRKHLFDDGQIEVLDLETAGDSQEGHATRREPGQQPAEGAK
jgi:hypothetical protein